MLIPGVDLTSSSPRGLCLDGPAGGRAAAARRSSRRMRSVCAAFASDEPDGAGPAVEGATAGRLRSNTRTPAPIPIRAQSTMVNGPLLRDWPEMSCRCIFLLKGRSRRCWCSRLRPRTPPRSAWARRCSRPRRSALAHRCCISGSVANVIGVHRCSQRRPGRVAEIRRERSAPARFRPGTTTVRVWSFGSCSPPSHNETTTSRSPGRQIRGCRPLRHPGRCRTGTPSTMQAVCRVERRRSRSAGGRPAPLSQRHLGDHGQFVVRPAGRALTRRVRACAASCRATADECPGSAPPGSCCPGSRGSSG